MRQQHQTLQHDVQTPKLRLQMCRPASSFSKLECFGSALD
jgi:hypothetical protein